MYITASFPAVEGENRGEEDVSSGGLFLLTSACGREGRVPLRNHMKTAVTFKNFSERAGAQMSGGGGNFGLAEA